MIIAIDGPAGAGKTTTSKALAKAIGFSYLDTGAMYRTVAIYALDNNIDLEDDEALEHLVTHTKMRVERTEDENIKVLINEQDLSHRIRTKEANLAVTPVSASQPVRKELTSFQQHIGYLGDYIVEGRDIGTVVFPDAELKIFLTASPYARAMRRYIQNQENNITDMSFDEIYADIIRRDEKDSSREFAPLKQAKDAFLIDNTDKSFIETLEYIIDLFQSEI